MTDSGFPNLPPEPGRLSSHGQHLHFTRDIIEGHPHILLGACVQVSAIDGQCGTTCLWPLSWLHTERLGLLRTTDIVSAKDSGVTG